MNRAVDAIRPKSHSFGLPLILVIIAIGWMVGAPQTRWASLTGMVLVCSAILSTLIAADHSNARRRAMMALLAIAVVLGLIGNIYGNDDLVRGVGELVVAVPIVVVALRVLQWIGTRPVVNFQCVLGGVVVYLLIGLMFAELYGAAVDLSSAATSASAAAGFFCDNSNESVTQSVRVYFSFSTITTTGFGDYVPCTRAGHAMAMTEAIFGQVYLVTILALLVGNIGRRRGSIKEELEAGDPSDEGPNG